MKTRKKLIIFNASIKIERLAQSTEKCKYIRLDDFCKLDLISITLK